MDLDLTGKHALVGGGSSGIGHAAAIELALLGADVTVLARHEDSLREVVDALPRPQAMQRHGWIAVDMDDSTALRAKTEAVVAAHPVQLLINNTAGPPAGAAHSADPQAFVDAFRRHVLGGQILLQVVLPGMKTARYGRLVNVISTSVREPIANLGVSNTVRGAVASWAKTLSAELAPFGITVNNVLPGFTETGRLHGLIAANAKASGKSEEEVAQGMRATVPAGRFARPDEPGAAIAFLCTPAAAYINGVSLAVDGGRTRSI